MQRNTSLSRHVSLRSATLIASLLLNALVAFSGSAANADDFISSAEPKLAVGTTSKPDEAVRLRMSETYGKLHIAHRA